MDAGTINKILPVLLFIAAFGAWSCEKDDPDPDYPFRIAVKTEADTVRVANVLVEVLAPIPDSDVYFRGFTNEEGEISFKYNSSALFLVRASRGERPDYTWIGCTEIRLRPNEEVEKVVYLEPFDPNLQGCSFDL